jgi:hypothetical protein
MVTTLQFVDSISASAGVRLDLNVLGEQMLANGFDLSPPPLRRFESESSMRDGSVPVGSVYGNRTVTLPLHLLGALSADGLASLESALMRELDRPTNFLRWKRDGASTTKYLATYRAEGRRPGQRLTDYLASWELDIPAFPFALGLLTTLSSVTVNNDPAHATNPMLYDLPTILGDAATPLHISAPFLRKAVLATRSRGTPANVPFVLQAESMTAGTDTTITGSGDPLSSGGGYARVSYATNPAMVTRLTKTAFPTSAGVDARGTYLVYARIRRTGIAEGKAALVGGKYGGSADDTVTLPLGSGYQWVPLGLVEIPGVDSPTATLDGTSIPVAGRLVQLQMQRTSASGDHDVDVLLFVPADESLAIVNFYKAYPEVVFDGPNDKCYGLDAAGAVMQPDLLTERVEYEGGLPLAVPGATNRLYLLRNVTTATADLLTDTTALDISYYPRYLSV